MATYNPSRRDQNLLTTACLIEDGPTVRCGNDSRPSGPGTRPWSPVSGSRWNYGLSRSAARGSMQMSADHPYWPGHLVHQRSVGLIIDPSSPAIADTAQKPSYHLVVLHLLALQLSLL